MRGKLFIIIASGLVVMSLMAEEASAAGRSGLDCSECPRCGSLLSGWQRSCARNGVRCQCKRSCNVLDTSALDLDVGYCRKRTCPLRASKECDSHSLPRVCHCYKDAE